MLNIKAKNINEAYLKVLLEVFRKDERGDYLNAYITGIDSGSFGKNSEGCGQERLQVDLLAVEIEHPEAMPRHILMSDAVGMPHINDARYIEDYANRYILNSLISENETYTYGSRIFEFPVIETDPLMIHFRNKYKISTFDQFSWVVKHLKEFPKNNHCCIQIATGNDLELNHSPCLRNIDLKIVENKLNMTLFFRSWDIFSAMPSNIAAFQLFNELLVDEIGEGLKTGKLFGISSGAHIYSSVWEYARKPYEYYILGGVDNVI